MITQKQIKKAAYRYSDWWDEHDAFIAGAEWAINEMNKTEWKVPSAEDIKEIKAFAENNGLIWDKKDVKNIEIKHKDR